jgi:DnaA family protein
MKQLPLGVRLRAGAKLAKVAPGRNAEIVSALRDAGSGPLWLWGAPGAGKTHLLQAVCVAAGDTAAYFPLNRTLALPPDALFGFESSSVLCLDDVGEVAGDPGWEEALFRLFNEGAEMRTRLIFAARAAPRQFEWRLLDWRSRAAACVVYHVHDLDDAGRVEALQLRAAQRGLDLPAETADYLLRRIPRDLDSLYAVLDQLDEASLIAQRRLTIPFIRDALETPADTKPSRKTS